MPEVELMVVLATTSLLVVYVLLYYVYLCTFLRKIEIYLIVNLIYAHCLTCV